MWVERLFPAIRVRWEHLGPLVGGFSGYDPDCSQVPYIGKDRRIKLVFGRDAICSRCPYFPGSKNFRSGHKVCDPDSAEKLSLDQRSKNEILGFAARYGVTERDLKSIRSFSMLLHFWSGF